MRKNFILVPLLFVVGLILLKSSILACTPDNWSSWSSCVTDVSNANYCCQTQLCLDSGSSEHQTRSCSPEQMGGASCTCGYPPSASPSGSTDDGQCKIQGYKTYLTYPETGYTQNTSSPISTAKVSIDSLSLSTTNNPHIFTYNRTLGSTKNVTVNVPTGYTAKYTLCYNDMTCHNTSKAQNYSGAVSVSDNSCGKNGYADLWFHFYPIASPTPTLSPTPSPSPTPISSPTIQPTPNSNNWGKISNSLYQNETIRGVFLYAGPPNPNSLPLYTRIPLNADKFNWKDEAAATFILNQIKNTYANTIKLSWWGENNEDNLYAPTLNSKEVNLQTFQISNNLGLLVVPVLEVSSAFQFWDEFPSNTTNLETRIKAVLRDYGSQPNWLTLYDKNGESRKVIWLIETIHGSNIDVNTFAQAFDVVAADIKKATGENIGFIIDPTPLPPNGSYAGPDPTALLQTQSLLAINPFNITSDGNTETERLNQAEQILIKWRNSTIPLIAPILSGYDDHIVRSSSQIYGDTPSWREQVKNLAIKYETDGITLDVWNGFTEGYVFTPTVENKYDNYNLAKSVFLSMIPSPAFSISDLKLMLQYYLSTDDSKYYPMRGKVNVFDTGYLMKNIQ